MNLFDKGTLCRISCFCYRFMVASVPLLEFAIPRCSGILQDYYKRHAEEERGHDDMLKDDLLRLGVEDIPLLHSAAQFAGSQYYLIAHEHPAMLLGYMHALERESLPIEFVDALCKHHGVELSSMRHHALHDPYHKVELEKVVATLPAELRNRVEWNERNILNILEGVS